MSEFHHVSVLLEECIEGLAIKPEGTYVDGTLGGAGHSSRIAAELTTGRHIGIDRDPIALKAAGERLKPWADRVTLVHSNFCEIAKVLDDRHIALMAQVQAADYTITILDDEATAKLMAILPAFLAQESIH